MTSERSMTTRGRSTGAEPGARCDDHRMGRPARVRLRFAVAAVAGLGCLAAACSATPARSVVALGDSVPRGTHCGCRPYPQLTADDLAARTGRPAAAANDAVAGATAGDVLRQLRSDVGVMRDVRSADAIEIEVGANDVAYSSSCGTAVDCYAPRLAPLRTDLDAIVARTRALTSRRRVVVTLLDYWNVWLGGRYAAARGPAYVAAAEEMTDRVDGIIRDTAAASGAHYVDLRAAFKGPDYAYDETHFLSSDGDHPNAAGHERIARAVDAVVAAAPR
jgi:acyl-CoA thioesterase I